MSAPTLSHGREINLLDRLPQTKRDPKARAQSKTQEDRALAKQFGRDFFDGERRHGYGGYRYDGRWLPVARRLVEYYRLGPNARILDVGAAKGFLLHDLLEVLPGAQVRGIDVSTYAKANAYGLTGGLIDIGSAERLPYADQSFDLVISINSIHNLPPRLCAQALAEMERVSRAHKFVTVDAWRTPEEQERLLDWILTAQTFMHVDDWKKLFANVGYTGDYWWFIP
jgi:SAM-dependent methyltransferase